MALLRYLTKGKSAFPDKSTCPSLTRKEVDSANECVKDSLQLLRVRVHAYYMYGTTAKFNSANTFILAARDQTAKFKDCQYFRLYGR